MSSRHRKTSLAHTAKVTCESEPPGIAIAAYCVATQLRIGAGGGGWGGAVTFASYCVTVRLRAGGDGGVVDDDVDDDGHHDDDVDDDDDDDDDVDDVDDDDDDDYVDIC